MLFAVFSNSRSLRVLEQRFNASPSHHYHLHTRTIYRSTLADALARKSITPFITLAQSLMQSANRKNATGRQNPAVLARFHHH